MDYFKFRCHTLVNYKIAFHMHFQYAFIQKRITQLSSRAFHIQWNMKRAYKASKMRILDWCHWPRFYKKNKTILVFIIQDVRAYNVLCTRPLLLQFCTFNVFNGYFLSYRTTFSSCIEIKFNSSSEMGVMWACVAIQPCG